VFCKDLFLHKFIYITIKFIIQNSAYRLSRIICYKHYSFEWCFFVAFINIENRKQSSGVNINE
jgi:hypothetical protein